MGRNKVLCLGLCCIIALFQVQGALGIDNVHKKKAAPLPTKEIGQPEATSTPHGTKKIGQPNIDTSQTNSTESHKEGGFVQILDAVLQNEFKDDEARDLNNTGGAFNSSVKAQEAVLETVARVSHDKPKKNESESDGKFGIQDLMNKDDEPNEDVERLIDSEDNVFVISNPNQGGTMVLQQDIKFITDLVIVVCSAAVGGIICGLLGQPVITGYLVAGSVIGPGGFSWVNELVQVETLAQFGIVFLLFGLGLEFSASKIKAVRGVAVMGGTLQILLFMGLCGAIAVVCNASASEGIFVGAFMSMSSTAVVLKCLSAKDDLHSTHGQIIMGTLILQDCAVGMLFALLPSLGKGGTIVGGVVSMVRVLMMLIAFGLAAVVVARTLLPPLLDMIIRLCSQSHELYQLAIVAFCLGVAWLSDSHGLSLELGAFVAGLMIASTSHAETTQHQVEPIRNLFAGLFLASIGMLINPHFLWTHIDILLISVIVVVLAKTILVTAVVLLFGYSPQTSVTVAISLAQIGEFAFVLLSRASSINLVQKRVYLLLLGTTALSLITTPLLFRAMPLVYKLGHVVCLWPREPKERQSNVMNGDEVERIRVGLVGPLSAPIRREDAWQSSIQLQPK